MYKKITITEKEFLKIYNSDLTNCEIVKKFNIAYLTYQRLLLKFNLQPKKRGILYNGAWNNKGIVLAAVTKDGMALQYASTELKNNKEVVLTAVKNDGRALKFAKTKLQNDKDVVLAAVKQNSYAFRFASEELQKDKELIKIAKGV